MIEANIQGVKKRPSPIPDPYQADKTTADQQKESTSQLKAPPLPQDDITLFMAWHNWCLTQQNRFLTDFSMFQFSQNQLLLQQIQQQSLPSAQNTPTTSSNVTLINNNQNATSVEVKVASFKRRLAAELIDFFFLLLVKIFVISYFFGDEYSNHFQYVLIIDENTTLEDLQMTLLQALLFRVAAIGYEGYCISGTLPYSNSATIGKRLMGLDVIRCELVEDIDALEGRVRVYPGGPVGVTRSMIRATLKNAIISLFFPILIPFQLMTSHNRLIYEQAAGTIVIKKE